MNDTGETPRPEISLAQLWAFLWRHAAIIGSCIVVFAVAAGALSYVLTPRFRAEVEFSPLSGGGSSLGGSVSGSLGGLAALAGINLTGGKRSDESLEYLRSREFTRGFIERHGLMPVLFAKRWDARSGQWTGKPPTINEGVEYFRKKIEQITEDHRTGIVTLAVIWRDRIAAAQWANTMVAEADAALRAKVAAESERSIEYLKEEDSKTPLVELHEAVGRTMETELKDAMVARTRDAYAFKVLDPAVVRDPQDTASPNRMLIVALGAGFGLLLGVIMANVRVRRRARA
jgi:uncharacterized protein involved in exopolysaccharide biosynthesis